MVAVGGAVERVGDGEGGMESVSEALVVAEGDASEGEKQGTLQELDPEGAAARRLLGGTEAGSDMAEAVQRQLQEHFGHSTSTAVAEEKAAIQDFMEFWCEADLAASLAPEWAAAALGVQRLLRERCGLAGSSAGITKEIGARSRVHRGLFRHVQRCIRQRGFDLEGLGRQLQQPDPFAGASSAAGAGHVEPPGRAVLAGRLVTEDAPATKAFSWQASSVFCEGRGVCCMTGRAGFRGFLAGS